MEIKSRPEYDNRSYDKLQVEIKTIAKRAIERCNKTRVAIDIGGHLGFASNYYSKHFEKVHTFEPLFYKHTKINLDHLDNVEVYSHGLGKEEKIERIWIAQHNIGGSSMVSHPLRERKWMHKAQHKDVKVLPLDSFNFTNVDFIKIDVESYEYEVLKGAENTIKMNKPIIAIEILKTYQPNYKKIVKYIHKLGYKADSKFNDDIIFKYGI